RALTAGRSDFCRRSAADGHDKAPPRAHGASIRGCQAHSQSASARPSSEFAGHLHPLRPAASRKHQGTQPHCWHLNGYRACPSDAQRSEEHTSELQSRENLVCRLLLEKKNPRTITTRG